MTRQQRITLEQVRAKKSEAMGRMNEALKKIADTPVEDSQRYHQLLGELSRARRDFDTWTTVFDTLDTAREFPLSYPELNVDEHVWIGEGEGRWIVVVGDPFDGLQVVGLFPDGNEASAWASNKVDGQTYWVLHLQDRNSIEWG